MDTTHSGNVSGALLYAKTDETITPDHQYLMDGNRITVTTLDIDKDFAMIRGKLDELADGWLSKSMKISYEM